MPDNQIFRKQALDTISNPEQLDQHVRITRPSVWIIVIGIMAILVGVFVWSVTGTITTSEKVNGILFPADSVKIATSNSGGTVVDVLVEENQEVEKGDILAVIPDLKTLEQIGTINEKYKNASDAEKEQYRIILNSLKREYVANSFVTASKSGTINKIVQLNDVVEPGQQVAINVAKDESSSSKEILAYADSRQAMNFKVGMEAQVTPAKLKREEYGYMKGVITKIGTTPVTLDSVVKSMGTPKYISALQLTGRELEVRIKINSDANSRNGLEWSNQKGANAEVNTGALCNIQVIVDSKKPISMFVG